MFGNPLQCYVALKQPSRDFSWHYRPSSVVNYCKLRRKESRRDSCKRDDAGWYCQRRSNNDQYSVTAATSDVRRPTKPLVRHDGGGGDCGPDRRRRIRHRGRREVRASKRSHVPRELSSSIAGARSPSANEFR